MDVPEGYCQRCGGSGLGNVCFPSSAALNAHCADMARDREVGLVEDLAATPAHQLNERLRRIGRKHAPELRDRVLQALQSRVSGDV